MLTRCYTNIFTAQFALDMEAMEPLFSKVFGDLKVDPSQYWVMFSTPGNFGDNIKQQFMDLFINKFKVSFTPICTTISGNLFV